MPGIHVQELPMTRRTRHQLRCQCCGLLFPSMHPTAKWCSNACNQHAFRQRRKAAALVVQPTVINDPDELPASWRIAAEPAGLEVRRWNCTDIQRRQADGYVNATAMCKANGREWFTYARSARAQEYIAALQDHLNWIPEPGQSTHRIAGESVPDLIQSIQGGTPDLQGTWIHPRLAVDLARWISPVFAVWMDGWFLDSLGGSSGGALSAHPRLPQLPPAGPAILIRAQSDHEARMVWLDAVWQSLSADKRPRFQRIAS
jgi:hypothetical protein